MTAVVPAPDPVETPGAAVPDPTAPPNRLHPNERMRIRAASALATRVLPAPIGQLVCRELGSWEEFGWRLERGGLVMRVVRAVETMPPPAPDLTVARGLARRCAALRADLAAERARVCVPARWVPAWVARRMCGCRR